MNKELNLNGKNGFEDVALKLNVNAIKAYDALTEQGL